MNVKEAILCCPAEWYKTLLVLLHEDMSCFLRAVQPIETFDLV